MNFSITVKNLIYVNEFYDDTSIDDKVSMKLNYIIFD